MQLNRDIGRWASWLLALKGFRYEEIYSGADAMARAATAREVHFETIHQFENSIAVEVPART
jgi:hypothetical protein